MDVPGLVAQVRDHFVEQFVEFAEEQRRSCTRGAAEVKFQLGEPGALFQGFYCADFVKNDDSRELIELKPGRVLSFEPISASLDGIALRIEQLHWDDVQLHHDLAVLPDDKVAAWFKRWFDPDDERHEPGAKVSNVIHSLSIEPNKLSVDFGTAAPEAFWSLLQSLKEAGASTIRVASSAAD